MNTRNFGPGLVLIVLGAIILLSNLEVFDLWNLWPVLVILLGLFFFGLWIYDRDNYGLLMPATIVTIAGVLFLYCDGSGWFHMQDLWPVFLVAPGIGFMLMYFFGEQEGGLLVPGTILLVIGIIFLSANRWAGRWWPAILVFVGVLLLIRPPRRVIGQIHDDGAPPPGPGEPSGEEPDPPAEPPSVVE